jgi:hypothetical protein
MVTEIVVRPSAARENKTPEEARLLAEHRQTPLPLEEPVLSDALRDDPRPPHAQDHRSPGTAAHAASARLALGTPRLRVSRIQASASEECATSAADHAEDETPWGPRSRPTGGAGVARPASSSSFAFAIALRLCLAISYLLQP